MMYNNKFVAVVSVAGKIAREVREETGHTVYLPPGSEYSLRLKNLHTQRAAVSITIDGRDVLDGSKIVVNAGAETDIEGFLDSRSNIAHNRFKLIEKTREISEHRSDDIADGLISIKFQFEKPLPEPYIPPYRPVRPIKKGGPWRPDDPWYPDYPYPKPFWSTTPSPGVLRGQSFNSAVNNVNAADATMDCCSEQNFQCSAQDVQVGSSTSGQSTRGFNKKSIIDDVITVEGSVVDQRFTTTYLRELEETEHVIVLQLKGVKSDGEVVRRPLLVKTAAKCHTCGRQNKSSSRHCSNCGTCLV